VNQPELIIVPSFFFMVGYIVWVWVSAAQRKARLKLVTEFNSRLLDRLGSVKDFSEFLQTEAGARFMQDLTSEPITSGPHERILRTAQFAAVLICLGFGLLLLSFFFPTFSDSSHNSFTALGVISLSLGIGFGASAGASYRLAGMLGLLNRPSSGATLQDGRRM
jgi:hypothetical protein